MICLPVSLSPYFPVLKNKPSRIPTMTACYLYAITQAPAPDFLTKVGLGLRDLPLQVVIHDQLAAVMSDWRSPLSNSSHMAAETDLWRHEQVIEGIMAQGRTLPVRFGTTLADVDCVHQLLMTRAADFTTDLAYVADRVEMGLRILWDPPVGPENLAAENSAGFTPGRQYLQQQILKRRQEQAIRAPAETFVAALNAILQPLFVDIRLQILPTERLLLSASYLVQQTLVDAFQAQVAALSASYPSFAFLCSGPWPAYHFVRNAQPTGKL